MDTADVIQDIEESKMLGHYRSVNTTVDGPPSPKKIEFMDARRMTDGFMRSDSQFGKSVSNFEAIYEDMDIEHPISFDKQDLLVGSRAKKKFWELYKSDRSFKDFNPKEDTTEDPRFAYFQHCKKKNI